MTEDTSWLKALVILLYYDRPNMLRNALRSFAEAASQHANSVLVVNDDGSPRPADPIVREMFPEEFGKTIFVKRSDITWEKKAASGGLVGMAMNRIIAGSDADFAMMLCDDDMLHPQAIRAAAGFFANNPDILSCYGHVLRYDPLAYNGCGVPEDASPDGFQVPLNAHVGPINGCCLVDASQVAWRLSCNKERSCWFDYPRTKDLDARFFNELFHRCGPMHFAGCVFQYKGVHPRQLGVVGLERAWAEGGLDADGEQ